MLVVLTEASSPTRLNAVSISSCDSPFCLKNATFFAVSADRTFGDDRNDTANFIKSSRSPVAVAGAGCVVVCVEVVEEEELLVWSAIEVFSVEGDGCCANKLCKSALFLASAED